MDCLSDASQIPFTRNCMGTISEVCAFFHMSTKRTEIFKSVIIECYPEQKKNKKKKRGHWFPCEKHDESKDMDLMLLFKEIPQPINLGPQRIEGTTAIFH